MSNKWFLLALFLLPLFSPTHAQLCQGSLGDPIINITFGAGANPGPSLTNTKNLNYVFNDCPQDGFYTIRNNTNACFANTWHTLNNDHTGDVQGYFMLINASLQKSEFYIDTLSGLCPNTTYEFAAWITNVILPSACMGNPRTPNLTFNIEKTDGTILQTYTTGDIASTQSPIWNQYGSFFTTPAGITRVVLRLTNNSVGGCGNDLAIDDITFRPCGPQLTPSIKGVTGKFKVFCVGESADVTLECKVSAGFTNPNFLWQQSNDGGRSWTDITGATNISLNRSFSPADPPGDYFYRMVVVEASNANSTTCRVASDALTVSIKANPVITTTSNSPVCQGDNIQLRGTGGSAESHYKWSGTNAFSAIGSFVSIKDAQSANSGKYILQVTDANGCKNNDSIKVSITPAPLITTSFSSKVICKGDSVVLGSAGGVTYNWLPSTSLSSTTVANPIAKPTDSIVYTIIITDISSCKASATVTIHVLPKPIANAGLDKTIVEGQSVQLGGELNGSNASVTWSPNMYIDNINILRPTVNPIINTDYVLTAISNNGCGMSTDTTFIRVFKKVVIPNAFSPNGDGINDTWNIAALAAYDNYQLTVLNRYGKVVFETKDYSQPWNGTFNGNALPVGTYYYLLDLKLGLPVFSGFVVLLR